MRHLETAPAAPDGRPADEQPQWRQDFPVDVPQDNYVARRDFVKFLVLTSVAFATGQLSIVAASLARRGRPEPAALPIVEADRLPVGGAKAFAYPGPTDACLLVRVDESTFVAYSQKCTHLSCAVVPEPERERFFCPCQEGSFDLRTGRPLAGPPRRPLPRIGLEVRDGVVYATGVEERML
jgi:nitrite reductase/ring-hydroxylating ferredoxin subunit